MSGDIDVAGFLFTPAEWQALDAETRAALLSVVNQDEPWVVTEPERGLRGYPRPRHGFGDAIRSAALATR